MHIINVIEVASVLSVGYVVTSAKKHFPNHGTMDGVRLYLEKTANAVGEWIDYYSLTNIATRVLNTAPMP